MIYRVECFLQIEINPSTQFTLIDIPGQREITQPGGRNYLCKCDLAGYEMEICNRGREQKPDKYR